HHHQQRTGAGQQPVLRGQHISGETAPRPHATLSRGGRSAHHQQQRHHPDPGQPPPGRRGKGKRGQRADHQRRHAPGGAPSTRSRVGSPPPPAEHRHKAFRLTAHRANPPPPLLHKPRPEPPGPTGSKSSPPHLNTAASAAKDAHVRFATLHRS